MIDRTQTTATLAEIAAALGISREAALKRAKKDAWAFETLARGGRPTKIFPLATLPPSVSSVVYMYIRNQEPQHDASAPTRHDDLSTSIGRGVCAAGTATPLAGDDQLGRRADGNHLVAQQNSGQRLAHAAPVAAAHFDPADLDDHQRQTDYARRAIREFVESYPGSVKGALNQLNINAADGVLNKRLTWAYANCHDKKRAGQTLNKKTYYNWLAIKAQSGRMAPAKKQKVVSVKPWHAAAVALRQRPQGSTLRWILEQLNAQGHAVSYDQVARFFRDEFSALDQLKGRFTGSKLRSHTFYQHRSSAGLLPADEVHADGWNTHFSAPHPVTGEFVTYEVWHFHDVVTRYVTPPGLGLTEQFEVIAKGLENYIRVFGRPQHVQTDSTKIIRGSDRFTHALHSLEERIGCTIVHPKEVGNSQANGICENFNTSWLDKQSRALATYQSPRQMDELSYKRVKKLTGKMTQALAAGDLLLADKAHTEAERMGKGRVFKSHAEAVAWINQICADYNQRPHRSLPKVRGEDGKLRHQTPAEALAVHVANGWQPVAVDEDELIDLFRPVTRVKVSRETVSPYGGMRYRNPEVLGHWNGKEVMVSYDIHDYQVVWVKELNGAPICEAQFVAATGYRAQSARDAAEEKRAKAQIRALENKIKRVEAERLHGEAIDADDDLVRLGRVIDLPASHYKKEVLRDVREVCAELDAQAGVSSTPPEAKKKPIREMTWEETKMWLHGNGRDLREDPSEEEEDAPPEQVAAG